MRLTIALAVSCLVATSLSAADRAVAAIKKQTNIPAQELESALEMLAKQQDFQILYRSEIVARRKTQGAAGELTVDESLTRLLVDTGLTYRYLAGHAVTIVPAASGDQAGRETGASRSASVELDEVIVTGTHIRGIANPTTSVQTYDRETIASSGVASMEEFTRLLPQNLGSQSQFSFGSSNQFDVTSEVGSAGVDLRGLGAGSTLSLINGRRMPGSTGLGFADISVLPLTIIDRVEVLSDGASALYGADAVGGVVNFSTRRDLEGVEVQARLGSVTEASKQDSQISLAAGTSWASGNALLSGYYAKEEPLLFSDRPFTQSQSLQQPDGYLLAEEETYTVYGNASQALGPVRLQVDGMYTQRDASMLSRFNVIDDIDNHVALINTNFNIELSGGMDVDFFADFSENEGTRSGPRATGPFASFTFRDRLLTLEGRLSGRLFAIAGGDVATAFGGVSRQEGYKETRFNSPFITDAERWVHAAYGELLVPLVGERNARPLVNRLDLTMAGRFETTDSFGDVFMPKIGLRWKPLESLSFRGGYSESFRAPPMRTLHGRRQLSFWGYNNPGLGPSAEDPRLLPGLVYAAAFGGGVNPDLEAEEADVWNAGLDWQPSFAPGLKFTTTYFNIDYRNRIVDVPAARVLGNYPRAIAAFPEYATPLLYDTTPDVAYIQSFLDDPVRYLITNDLPLFVARTPVAPTLAVPRAEDVRVLILSGPRNIAVSKVRGVDFNLSHAFSTGVGDFSADLSGTRLLSNEFQATPAANVADTLDRVYRPIDLRMRGTLAWRLRNLGVTAAVNYADGYEDDINRPQLDSAGRVIPRPVDSWTTVDVGVSYDFAGSSTRLLDKTKLSLNVLNVFDTDPPLLQIGDGYNFDTANASPLGRYVSLTLNTGF